jgi:hypothetical protein
MPIYTCSAFAGQAAGAPALDQLASSQGQLAQEQLQQLPASLQLQSHLLQCMHLIVQHLPSGVPLPRGLGHVLLEHLLLPRPLLQQELVQSQQLRQALEMWTQQQQHLSMQVSWQQLYGSTTLCLLYSTICI